MAEEFPLVPSPVGLLGGGVIGAGWAARFLLNGADVRLFDPDPAGGRKVAEVLDNARAALRSLVLAPLPAEGRLELVDTVEAAATGAAIVQESVPERVELKRSVLQAADLVTGPDVVLASSTSGIRPSELAAGLRHPDRLCVGHPFNPVYLLPLVELVAGRETAPATLAMAAAAYRSVGMHPLEVRAEVDGFLADRLLEALWREALWLVHDGVATVAEVDDAIRFGPGLRWSVMGSFLSYRIAGGEAGMRHFLAQFGPALRWPWSRLTDVPDLDQALVERIAEQSDEQAAGRSVRELERLRDRSLVAVLQALRSQREGAGAVLEDYERGLLARAHPARLTDADAVPAPLVLHRTAVPAGWIDYNGHLHESRYLQLFGDASDALFGYLGVDDAYLAGGGSYYTVETHLRFHRALRAGDRVEVSVQVLEADARRIRAFLELRHEGEVVATAEHLYLHVDTGRQRAAPARADIAARAERVARAHASLSVPAAAGRRTGERP